MAHDKVYLVQTPTGPVALAHPVAVQLLKQGVISGDLDGVLHAADAAIVKSALMAVAMCDFCSVPGAAEAFLVPDFDMPILGRSTGGWAACETCAALIRAEKREALFQRAIESLAFSKFTRETIRDLHRRFWQGLKTLSKVTATAVEIGNLVEDRVPEFQSPAWGDRERRVHSMMKLFQMTEDEVEAAVRGEVSAELATKIAQWGKKYGQVGPQQLLTLLHGAAQPKPMQPDVTPHWQRALDMRFKAIAMLQTFLARQDRSAYFNQGVDLTDPAAVQRALDATARINAISELRFGDDLKYLRTAEAYSFNPETMAAIQEAARSIPHESPLSSVETPNTGSGWFWFAEPLLISAPTEPDAPASDEPVHALLWSWTEGKATTHYEITLDDTVLRAMNPFQADRLRATIRGRVGVHALTDAEVRELTAVLRESLPDQPIKDFLAQHVHPVQVPGVPSIMFSAYVLDDHAYQELGITGPIKPSIRWFWPFHLTVAEMVTFNGTLWDENYGTDAVQSWTGPELVGKAATLDACRTLSLFFLQACVWFKQTVPADPKKAKQGKPSVLSAELGHVERHARKQYVRDYNLAEPPTVRVIALRKTARVERIEVTPTEGQAGAPRTRHFRTIVSGHNRLQACGPGRRDRKLRWIEAHMSPKDDSLPLRIREKVFAVVR